MSEEGNVENSMEAMYNADKGTTASVWYFDPDAYMENTILCNNMISGINEQIDLIQKTQSMIVGQMKSPEGQEIVGDITVCLSAIKVNTNHISEGLGYILKWSTDRYNNAVQSSRISVKVVQEIQEELNKAGLNTSKTWSKDGRTYKYDPTTRKSANCKRR